LWIFFIPLVGVKLYWQLECLNYTTLPYMQAAGKFKVLRFIDMGMRGWLIMVAFMSIGQTMDYGTDSFFIAVVLRAGQCTNSRVEEIWHEVISQSVFPFLADFTFGHLALLSYFLMFLQPVFAFSVSTPRDCCADDSDYSVGVGKPFKNWACLEKNYGDALFDLADVSDMVSIQLMSPIFPRAKAEKAWEAHNMPTSEKVTRISNLIHNALNRSLGRIGLVTLLENAYQINLQVSILGLFTFIQENGSEHERDIHIVAKLQIQTKISILLGIIQACARVGEVGMILNFCWWTIGRFQDARKTPSTPQTGRTSTSSDSSSHEETPICCEIFWVVAKATLVILSSLGFILSTGYAIVKFYNILFVCEDRLWNVTGCVDLSRYKNAS
jgi:hypothetical protein